MISVAGLASRPETFSANNFPKMPNFTTIGQNRHPNRPVCQSSAALVSSPICSDRKHRMPRPFTIHHFVPLGFVVAFAAVIASAQSPFDIGPADPAPTFERNTTPRSAPTSNGRVTNALIELIDRAELASTQTGVIAFEVPEEGTVVAKGQVVARLDDTIPQASLAVAEAQASTDAEVRSAKKIAAVADTEVEAAVEANRMFAGTVSKIDFNRLKLTAARSESDVIIAERDLTVAKARVHEAEMLLKTYEVTAPFAGIVRKRFKLNGEAVRQGDPVIELVSTARMRVTARVPIDQLARYQIGQRVQVIPEYNYRGGDTPMVGQVKFIDTFGKADVTLGKVDVQIEVANPDGRLVPGLQATVVVP